MRWLDISTEFKKKIDKDMGRDEKLQGVEKEKKKGFFDELLQFILLSYSEGEPFVLHPPNLKLSYNFFFKEMRGHF